MTQERWTAVDEYVTQRVVRPDEALEGALRASADARLPPIQVSAPQGKLLMLLAQVRGARRILEIGTLGGYSTIWLGRALPPGGSLVTLEADAGHAEVARRNIAAAGLAAVVDVRVGPALETLPGLAADGRGPFDLVFIDADKPNNLSYFEWALRLSRPGSVVVVDNVVREGAVLDAESADPRVVGTRRLYDAIATQPRVAATVVQTVGNKGYDGFLLALVLPA